MPEDEKPKKKMSAKEKRKQKELARIAEMERVATVNATREFKMNERDRVSQENVDRTRRHNEQVRGEREALRLEREAEIFRAIWADFQLRMNLKLSEHAKHKNWENIVKVSWLPKVDDEADINAFLSVWREGEFEDPGGEDKRRNIDKDFQICEMGIQLVNNIHTAVDEVYQNRDVPAFTKRAKAKIAFHNRNLANLFGEIQRTVDALTSNIMQFLDKYLDEGDDQALTLCQSNSDIKYGLWCGNKLPRIRSVDFGDVGITIMPKDGAHLPKQLNLMNNVAMRVLQYSFDPMSLHQDDDVGLEYYSLGGALVVETMSVPTNAKYVKEWTLRTETALAHDVQRLPYPPANQDSAAAAPPIRISFQVPPRVVVRQTAPHVGVWHPQRRCWLLDGTSDFSYDSQSRRATFLTQNLTTMAIVQEKGFDVPYEQWYMYPVSSSSVVFVVEGRRRGERSDKQVKILVSGDQCTLQEPLDEELAYLRQGWFGPATMLRHLTNSGFNFVLRDCDADYTPDILPKSWMMENKGYDDLAMFCTVFEFGSTRHNRFGEDKDMCLFRISKQMNDEDDRREMMVSDLDDDDKWYTVRYEKERCVLTQCRESDEIANIEELHSCETHLNLYMAMCAEFSEETVNSRIGTADLLLQNAIKQLLSLVRPFTWG
eukprot:NODE_285_length_2141_cov_74.681231_g279_i0.p1 GENE.NODE_285_length_2141_cov_74.681231_g279_i0~~NODE_285_length_2141_cov_74.681231_g279_i0.p1  ORF type:complete len:657 (-),score=137.30 NODE_285_length_2141_cov_74.681231_g279_i0:98-2068(-)